MDGRNKTVGEKFEHDFCRTLGKHGYWAHRLSQNKAGQPADVIAVKNGSAYLIDCKTCARDVFSLSRVEENQILSMGMWKNCGNRECYFALKLSDGSVRMIEYDVMINLSYEKTRLNLNDILENSESIEEWLE